MELTDQALLARFAADGSEEAFSEIVRRHVAWMYTAALRQVGERRLAEDVTQMVFVHLAQRAAGLSREVVLAGWLHRDVRFTSLDLLRSENRRRRREEASVSMNRIGGEPDPEWERIRPLLDEVLDQLGAEDRHALLLRFFQQREFAEVGQALGASAEAARKRVDRALERLRAQLEHRGIESAGAALAASLSVHAVETVPTAWATGLGASAVSQASAGSVAGGAVELASAGFMGKALGVAGIAAVLVGIGIPWSWQSRALAEARAENRRWREWSVGTGGGMEVSSDRPVGTSEAARERADLERLRREVATLRARLGELRTQASAKAGTRKIASDERETEGLLRVTSITDAGAQTPAALLQSHMAAMLRGDTNRLMELWAIEPGTDMENVAQHLENMREESEKGVEAATADLPLEGIRVIEQQSAAGGDFWLVHDYVMKTGEVAQRSRLLVRPSERGWKLVIGVDGQPVMEMLDLPR